MIDDNENKRKFFSDGMEELLNHSQLNLIEFSGEEGNLKGEEEKKKHYSYEYSFLADSDYCTLHSFLNNKLANTCIGLLQIFRENNISKKAKSTYQIEKGASLPNPRDPYAKCLYI